eukprot:TRINITY_DN9364_c0_g1_i1.p1 TRINITY_DN9364_c0_g1~~TRINITY_DN9364_c0_g1_i1.p1  ORF type:complete len:272 (+),score=30.30 TRINITY_DN9364_c0_g1_i1:37-852(+)
MVSRVGHCSPTSIYGWLVQLCIGIVAFSSVILRWSCEKHRRPVLTLLLDCGKQIVGGAVTHFTKVGFSVIIKTLLEKKKPCDPTQDCCDSECITYVVQSGFQALLVIPPAYVILQLVKLIARKREWKHILPFGDYGHPVEKKRIFLQLGAWTIIMVVCNLCVEMAFFIPLRSELHELGKYVFSWARCLSNGAELWIVILVVPVVIDTLQYLIYDTVIKRPHPEGTSDENRSLLSDVSYEPPSPSTSSSSFSINDNLKPERAEGTTFNLNEP